MAVTDRFRVAALSLTALMVLLTVQSATAATLPVDKVDVLYHRYDGGGMVIDGPSVLFRHGIGTQVSFVGQYYVAYVSWAPV